MENIRIQSVYTFGTANSQTVASASISAIGEYFRVRSQCIENTHEPLSERYESDIFEIQYACTNEND